MARMMCPVKKMEINVPDECPKECMHLKMRMCAHPDTLELIQQLVTKSGIPVKQFYGPEDLKDWDYISRSGNPGEYPFTRGLPAATYRVMYGGPARTVTYAGFGTPETTNQWYKYLINEGGVTALSCALDLPTQIGYDSDNPLALGEVGRQGVSIDSLADVESMLDGIPLSETGVGSVASGLGPIYLAWFLALNEKRGIPLQDMGFASQNDCLKEFIARGTQIFPVRPQFNFTCDVVEYCVRNGMKNTRPISISGTHMAEAGATAVQEMAFTLANAVAYIEELMDRGLDIDELASYLTTFFVSGMDLFEQICKFRAFRRMWSRMMRERFHAKVDTPPIVTAFTAGSTYTAQQPLNNIVRGTMELLAAVLGGLGGALTAAYDEAIALPSAQAITLAFRTQQILGFEAGLFDTADPLGGSYYVEALTDELEERATELFDKVEAMGGAIPAIEQGFQQREIAVSAYEKQRKIDSGEKVVVGVNKYATDEPLTIEVRKVDPEEERRQVEKVKKLKQERDNEKVKVCLKQVKAAAEEGINTVPSILEAVKAYATVGEICDTLRGVWGEFKPVTL